MSKFKSIFGGSPSVPALPPPPPPPPDNSGLAAQRKKVRQAEAQRKGRASTILTDQESGTLGDAPINRPGLRNSALLGG